VGSDKVSRFAERIYRIFGIIASVAILIAWALAFVFWYLFLEEPGLRGGSISPIEVLYFEGSIFCTTIGWLILSSLIGGILFASLISSRPGGYFAKLVIVWGFFTFAYGGFLTYSLHFVYYNTLYLWVDSQGAVFFAGIGLQLIFCALLGLLSLHYGWPRLQTHWNEVILQKESDRRKARRIALSIGLSAVLLTAILSGIALQTTATSVAVYRFETRRSALAEKMNETLAQVSWSDLPSEPWFSACELNVLSILKPNPTLMMEYWLENLTSLQAVNGSLGSLWSAWLISYAATNLDRLDTLNTTTLANYLLTYCYNNSDGGFYDPHPANPVGTPSYWEFSFFGSTLIDPGLFNTTNLESTFTALSILATLNQLDVLNASTQQKIIDWIVNCQHETGGFQPSASGYKEDWVSDSYGCSLYLTYFGIASANLLDASNQINSSSAASYIQKCIFPYGLFSVVPNYFDSSYPSFESSWSEETASDILIYMGLSGLALLNVLNSSTQESALTRLLQHQQLFFGPTFNDTSSAYSMFYSPIGSFFATKILMQLNQLSLLDTHTPRATAANSILLTIAITIILIIFIILIELITLLHPKPTPPTNDIPDHKPSSHI
jgi:prenyltransferase beta subunit